MKKIGFIDSGIGGLTLLREIIQQDFDAQYFYISDENNIPYGGKTQDFMKKQVLEMINKLISKNINTIVIACNTLTAETIDELRILYPHIPIIGIEPYTNYLNHHANEKQKIALILTKATFSSARFQKLREKTDPEKKISIYPLENLALIVEKLKNTSFSKIRDEVINELSPLKNKGYTHLILGCTHYPIIKDFIENHLNLKCIDPSKQVASHIQKTLNLAKAPNPHYMIEYNPNNSDVWIKKDFFELSFLKSYSNTHDLEC